MSLRGVSRSNPEHKTTGLLRRLRLLAMTSMKAIDLKERAAKAFTNSLMFLIVGFAIAKTISGVIINHIIEHFGLVGAEQGFMISVINIGTTVAILLTFILRWKFKKTSIIISCSLATVLMTALTGLSPSFYIVLAVSFTLGLSLGWTDVFVNSSIVDVNREDSAKPQSALQGWYGVGAIIAPIAISLLLQKTNWQGIYLIMSPVIFFTTVIFIIAVRSTRRQISVSATEARKITGEEIRLFLKNKLSVYLLLSCMTYYIMQYGLFAWLVRYMNVQHNAESLGMISITLMWVCTSIARFLVPRLPVDNLKMHAYGSLLAGVTLFIGIISNQPILACIMVGFGALVTGNSLPALINRCIVNFQGNSLLPASAMFLSMQITGMIVPPVLGWISVYSIQASMILPVAGILISGLLGLVIVRLLNHTSRKDI